MVTVTSTYPEKIKDRSKPDHLFNVSFYDESGTHLVTQRVRRHNPDELASRRGQIIEHLRTEGYEVKEI